MREEVVPVDDTGGQSSSDWNDPAEYNRHCVPAEPMTSDHSPTHVVSPDCGGMGKGDPATDDCSAKKPAGASGGEKGIVGDRITEVCD